MGFGNKGCILKVIKVGETLIEFINCHLYPGYGTESIANRTKDLFNILWARYDYLFKQRIDYIFLFGDTNFKIDVPKEKVILGYLQNPNCFSVFSEKDEFIINK